MKFVRRPCAQVCQNRQRHRCAKAPNTETQAKTTWPSVGVTTESEDNMPVITLPDGSQKQFNHSVSIHEIAESIGPRLAKAALAGKVDGDIVDTSHMLEDDAEDDTPAPAMPDMGGMGGMGGMM